MRNHWKWWPVVGGMVLVIGLAVFWALGLLRLPGQSHPDDLARQARKPSGSAPAGSEQATFGGGCFWCTEAVFQQLHGVSEVVSGYSGGFVKHPTYEQVCRGLTGHAEVIQITFDPKVISYAELLEVFWQTHNPTTRNRQGNDRGPQYRSVIFYHTPRQKEMAEHYKQKLDDSGAFAAPIVTEIAEFTEFYPAEAYHQNYFLENPRQPYCSAIIRPKLEKFEKVFKHKLRTTASP